MASSPAPLDGASCCLVSWSWRMGCGELDALMVEASPSSLIAMEGMEVELVDLTWLGASEAAIFATEAGASEEVPVGDETAGDGAAGEAPEGE